MKLLLQLLYKGEKMPECGDRGLPAAGYAKSTGRPDTDAYDAGSGAYAAQKSGWL